MRRVLSLTLSSLMLVLLALPISAQPPWGGPYAPPRDGWRDRDGGRDRDRIPAPNLNGTWYNQGDPSKPCEVIQRRPDGQATFINENGDRAWGQIRGDRVFIPDWTNGHGSNGLEGVIRGNRIVFPDGFWSR